MQSVPTLVPRHATTQRPASLSRNLSAPLPTLDSLADSDHLVRPRKSSFKDMRPSESKKLESLLSGVPSARTYNIAASNIDSHADLVQLGKSLIDSRSRFPIRQDSVKRLVLQLHAMKLRSSSLPPTLRQDAAFMHKEMRGGETLVLLTPRHATSDRPASLPRNLSAPLPILDILADSDHLVRP